MCRTRTRSITASKYASTHPRKFAASQTGRKGVGARSAARHSHALRQRRLRGGGRTRRGQRAGIRRHDEPARRSNLGCTHTHFLEPARPAGQASLHHRPRPGPDRAPAMQEPRISEVTRTAQMPHHALDGQAGRDDAQPQPQVSRTNSPARTASRPAGRFPPDIALSARRRATAGV